MLAESTEVRGTGGAEGPVVSVPSDGMCSAQAGPRLTGAQIMLGRISRGLAALNSTLISNLCVPSGGQWDPPQQAGPPSLLSLFGF